MYENWSTEELIRVSIQAFEQIEQRLEKGSSQSMQYEASNIRDALRKLHQAQTNLHEIV